MRTRPIEITDELVARHLAKVDRSAGAQACWPFAGKTQNGGYGVQHVGGRPGGTIYAHRLAFVIATGIDPVGLAVCHRCDNPPCCNPAHLFMGSIADNVKDMVAKGRWRTGPASVQKRRLGSAKPNAKLNEAMARDIRRETSRGASRAALARKHGVDAKVISCIARGLAWKHVA